MTESLNELGRFITKWYYKTICFFGWHDWDKYNGYYEERVADGAHCRRCPKVYHK